MSDVTEAIRSAELRPTRQRVALLELLYAKGDCHVTPETLHADAAGSGIRVSLATVYNTLNQFTDSGLLTRVAVDPNRTYFDTNVRPHHHFYDEQTQQLIDLPENSIECANLPTPPAGKSICAVDIVIRIK